MRPAKVAGSSSEKPEVSSDVSKSRCTRSLTVLSPLSAAALDLSWPSTEKCLTAAHVELDVARVLLLRLEEVERRALRHEEDRGELELALHAEVLHGEVLLPVVGEGLVEGAVLLLGDLLGLARPDGLLLVHEVPLVGDLLDLLLLLLLPM